MKIKNTLTQKELEILLRFSNWAHKTFEWRFGQALFNGLDIMFPATAEEIRGKDLDPFYRDTVKADFYAAICPDEPREKETDKRIVCFRCAEYADIAEEQNPFCVKCFNELNNT
jgi:hypothetical protein